MCSSQTLKQSIPSDLLRGSQSTFRFGLVGKTPSQRRGVLILGGIGNEGAAQGAIGFKVSGTSSRRTFKLCGGF